MEKLHPAAETHRITETEELVGGAGGGRLVKISEESGLDLV